MGISVDRNTGVEALALIAPEVVASTGLKTAHDPSGTDAEL